jgi:hypothetical protein
VAMFALGVRDASTGDIAAAAAGGLNFSVQTADHVRRPLPGSLIDGPEVEHGAHFLILYYPPTCCSALFRLSVCRRVIEGGPAAQWNASKCKADNAQWSYNAMVPEAVRPSPGPTPPHPLMAWRVSF